MALAGIQAPDGTAQPAQPGSLGIGLHLVRRLSEAHGGRYWVERPKDGSGVVFNLALPLAPEPIGPSAG